MGLFSGETNVYVGTVASRVIPDDMLPNSVKSGVLRAVLRPEQTTGVVDAVRQGLAASIGAKAEQMYRYARDHHTHGLPSGQYLTRNEGRELVQARLELIEGAPVTIDYCEFDVPNRLHLAWMQLVSLYDYDGTTNRLMGLEAAKGAQVFLENMVIMVPESLMPSLLPASLAQWGPSPIAGPTPQRLNLGPASRLRGHAPVTLDPNVMVTEIYAQVHIVWTPPGGIPGQVLTETIDMPLSGLATVDADHFHVRYQVGSATKFWLYRSGAGTYPELDAVHATAQTPAGSYFPFLGFRQDGVAEIADKTTASYQTSKRMAKYLGMDYDTVAEAIEENPDIDDVLQAMMVFAVPANTSDELERRYLFDYFESLFFERDTQWTQPRGPAAWDVIFNTTSAQNTVIQDGRYKMAISDRGITKRRVAGTIGPVGSHDSASEIEMIPMEFVDPEGVSSIQNVPQPVHHYRRQVTAGMYEEITVLGLRVQYRVSGQLAAAADEDDAILLVPIDRSLTQGWNLTDRERLYARSLHYVFCSIQAVKVKWYQTGLFQAVTFFVAVVITVVSYGSTFEALVAAFASASAAAVTTVVLDLVVKLVLGMVAAEVFQQIAEAVGGPVALALAVVAAVYSGVQAFQAGGLQGAPFAEGLLKIATGLAKGVGATIQEQLAQLAGEFDSLNLLKSDAEKEFERANKLLENSNSLSPFVIFGESPDDYYNRTVHSGNVGIHSIGAISSFVDNALRLPTLAQTLGGEIHV